MNRMKSTLSRFGIRGFKPTLRKADEKLEEVAAMVPFSQIAGRLNLLEPK